MRVIKGFFLLLVVMVAFSLSGQSIAQSDRGESARVFGLGQPQSVQKLPVGKLRNRLESLPPQASSRALRWLQDFSFPEADLDTIEIDDEGGVFYGDTLLPDPEQVEAAASAGPTLPADAPAATLDDAFFLHSRPGSSNVVFIDFDGAVISGTAWNGSVSQYDALPYNVEGDTSTFTTLERTRIVDIWHRVAEDLSPYDIDVTTEEPAVFDRYTGHILVTHSKDANGTNMPSNGGGGVAYLGVFGISNYHTYYSPALVYYDHLGSGGETYVAEASSHEFGHNLGLSHDGDSSKTGSEGTYYRGHGSGLVSWAPIMGNSYYNNITEWSKGEYTNANQSQDDLAIIDGKLGYRPDDHGDTRATAATLAVDPDGSVVSSNPELDPHNVLTENKGVIGASADVDVFSFVTGAGTISLAVTPAWDAFYRSSSRRGANLDIEAELQNLSGATVALNDPNTDTGASISTSVNAGTYYLLITGVGNTVTPYSDYDSLGQYFISGSVPPASADDTAPTPNPMTWASEPSATSHNAINMTATVAVDDTSAVEYNFLCIVGGTGCTNSGWQSGTGHTASGLAASTNYTYRVMARDQAGNETASSASASATTDAPPPPPLAPSGLSATGISETAISLSWSDNAATETAYRVERSPDGLNSFATVANLASNATGYTDTGLSAGTTYDYRVAAVNDSGDSGFANASGTTNAPPAYTNYSASSDTAMAGSVNGSVANTMTDDGSSQSITERESGGKPAKRHTYLEHRWNFNVSAGATVTVYANVWSSGSNDGDTFNFEYSLNNGSSFSPLSQFNVSVTASSNQQFAVIPGAPSGSIIIRVVDTDQSQGSRDKNTVFVDHLYIQVGNPSSDPPIGDPGGLAADAVSSSQIDLSWTDGTENEAGFTVDRSPDGSTGWSEIADLPGGSTSYSDTGLAAEIAYFYRVRAHNPNGFSSYTYADTTTPPAPPPSALSLIASGYKVKGKHHVGLSWTGSSDVVIYRDGAVLDLSPPGIIDGSSYDDNIGAKGGASYTHQVCDAITAACSNITTSDF